MRLVKHLAHSGVASRRASERIIAAGRVTIDGAIVSDPARSVGPENQVTVDGAPVAIAAQPPVVYVLNKPAGTVSTARDPGGRATVVELLDVPERVYPIGRLDRDTTGLLLLTNDGKLANRLMHPSFHVPKTYVATLAGAPLKAASLRALRDGIELDDGLTAPARARRLDKNRLELTIHEGRKRQVRRMCRALGHEVIELERVSVGPLTIGNLPRGHYRRLDSHEVSALYAATEDG